MSLFPTAQSSLGFPQPLAEKYRPRLLADFIGLEKQKKVLSGFARNPKAGAWLFIGDSGLGKTTMAQALADELKADTHFIPSQKCNAEMVEDTWRLCWNIPLFGPSGWHVVIADECDQMSNAAQLSLLSKLDSTARAPQTIYGYSPRTAPIDWRNVSSPVLGCWNSRTTECVQTWPRSLLKSGSLRLVSPGLSTGRDSPRIRKTTLGPHSRHWRLSYSQPERKETHQP